MARNDSAPQTRTPASTRGGVTGPGGIIDAAALTYASRRKVARIPMPATLVTNTTTKHSLGAHGINGNIVAAYVSYRTKPVIGSSAACTFKLVDYDGTTETDLTSAFDVVASTARVANALSPVATPPDVLGTSVLEVHVTVGNGAVTQGADGFLTVVYDPNEPTTISQ